MLFDDPAGTVLVLYASTHGHTEKIADRLADRLRGLGTSVRLVSVDEAGDLDPAPYALVVAGGSIHRDTHQPALLAWMRRFSGSLDPKRTAVFSVSLTAADDSGEAHQTVAGYVEDLAKETGHAPVLAVSFAGALQYREYPVATRVLMRLIARHRGLPTDPSADVDFTDWDTVDAFADAVATLVPSGMPTPT